MRTKNKCRCGKTESGAFGGKVSGQGGQRKPVEEGSMLTKSGKGGIVCDAGARDQEVC